MEIFAAGTHRNKDYRNSDLDEIVKNFAQFSAPDAPSRILRVPLVIGHSEDQEYLQRTDLPAAGWAVHVYAESGRLFADADGIPEEVARLIRGGAYRTVSAEIYDEPPEGVPARGKMLRRIAILGAEIPEVKGLADIPTPERYSERRPFARREKPQLVYAGRARLPGGCWAAFSEVAAMAEPSKRYRKPRIGETVNVGSGAQTSDANRRGDTAGRMTVNDRGLLGVAVGGTRDDTGDPVSAMDVHLKDDSGVSYGPQPGPPGMRKNSERRRKLPPRRHAEGDEPAPTPPAPRPAPDLGQRVAIQGRPGHPLHGQTGHVVGIGVEDQGDHTAVGLENGGASMVANRHLQDDNGKHFAEGKAPSTSEMRAEMADRQATHRGDLNEPAEAPARPRPRPANGQRVMIHGPYGAGAEGTVNHQYPNEDESQLILDDPDSIDLGTANRHLIDDTGKHFGERRRRLPPTRKHAEEEGDGRDTDAAQPVGNDDAEAARRRAIAVRSPGFQGGLKATNERKAARKAAKHAEPDDRPRGQRIDTPEETEQSRRELEEADDSPPETAAAPRTPQVGDRVLVDDDSRADVIAPGPGVSTVSIPPRGASPGRVTDRSNVGMRDQKNRAHAYDYAEPDPRPRGQRIDTPEETEAARRELEEADDSPPQTPAVGRAPQQGDRVIRPAIGSSNQQARRLTPGRGRVTLAGDNNSFVQDDDGEGVFSPPERYPNTWLRDQKNHQRYDFAEGDAPLSDEPSHGSAVGTPRVPLNRDPERGDHVQLPNGELGVVQYGGNPGSGVRKDNGQQDHYQNDRLSDPKTGAPYKKKPDAHAETEEPEAMREACMQKMAEHGLDPKMFDGMPDEHVGSIADALDSARSPMEDDDEEEDQWPMPDDEQDDDDTMQQYAERAHAYARRAKQFAERCSQKSKKFAERYRKFGEMNPEDDRDERSKMEQEERKRREMKKMKGGGPAMMSEQARQDLDATRRLRKFSERKHEQVESLIGELTRDGKLPPSQIPQVRQRLLRADSVTKFSEGGREVTELDLQARELRAIPSMFAEKFRQPVRTGEDRRDDELRKVQKFSESAQFSSALKAVGKTPAEYVANYEKARQEKPALTAEQYGVNPYFEG